MVLSELLLYPGRTCANHVTKPHHRMEGSLSPITHRSEVGSRVTAPIWIHWLKTLGQRGTSQWDLVWRQTDPNARYNHSDIDVSEVTLLLLLRTFFGEYLAPCRTFLAPLMFAVAEYEHSLQSSQFIKKAHRRSPSRGEANPKIDAITGGTLASVGQWRL